MATSAAMAKSIDEVEKDLNELLQEARVNVGPAFDRLITSTRQKVSDALKKEIIDYISPKKETKDGSLVGTRARGCIELEFSREAENYIAGRWPKVLPRWRKLRADVEAISRRLELRNASSEQDFKATLMWIAEHGIEVDLALLEELKKDLRYHSNEINRLIEIAEAKISERVSERYKYLRAFFNLSEKQFARLISIVNEKSEESISDHKRNSIKKLRSIKKILVSRFEQDEINRWLSTANPMFDSNAPVDIIAKGETDRVLQALVRLDEGIPNY